MVRPIVASLRHPVMGCTCAEGRYLDASGQPHWAPPVHDCRYVAWRESLVPDAIEAALRRCPKGTKDVAWTREFLDAMARETVAHPFVVPARVPPCLCGVAHPAA